MTLILNGSVGVSDVDGSAATPAIRGTDANTGMFFPAADTIAFAEGGVESMRITSAGDLGIGTTTPNAASGYTNVTLNNTAGGIYDINVSGTLASRWYANSTGAFLGSNTSVPLIFNTVGTERARIDTSGSLNVGGTGANNGGAILHAERSTSAVVGRYYASQASGYTSDVLQAITNQGSSTACTIFGAYYSGGAAFAFRVRGDGTIYAQNTTVQSASDVRFKENIVDATDGLNVVTALRPVRFDIKEGHGVSAKQNQLGFIAQEVKSVFPDAVDVWKESDDPEKPYLSLGASALIPVLVKAIQELKAQNDELKARVDALNV